MMAGCNASVEILLSTYNGAAHLEEFLASILGQEFDNWSLMIRDDGSSDGTVKIIEDWSRRFPHRIRLLDAPPNENLGTVLSFSRLMQHSTAPYVMFADQDDIWLPSKVRGALAAMRRQEGQDGASKPILVHTDLMVVDENLNTLANSLWRYQGLVPGRHPVFSRTMVENVVWGCTAMLNRSLVDLVESIPPVTIHHDWWIALVAAALGKIVSSNEQSILWRRHGRNESDISGIQAASLWALTDPRAARRRLMSVLEASRPRVTLYLERYRDRLQPEQIAAAEAFLHLSQYGLLSRRWKIIRHGLFFGSRTRNVALLALI